VGAMNPRTVATINRLDRSTWFREVGRPATGAIVVLNSWTAAIESCGSAEWEALTLEAANQYRERLLQASRERFAEWNTIVELVKPPVTALVQRRTADVVSAHKLPQVFVDVVRWDMLHLAMESEYADVFPPGFFASQAYWYLEGRFPCGWEGDIPKGRRIIY
jgi:hypothetical protein